MEIHVKNILNLTGKTALVTGASSGIGAATATLFADLGAKVAIGYHRNEEGAQKVRAQITSSGGTAVSIQADVRQIDGIESLVNTVTEEFGSIDILINNAGSLVSRQRIQEISETNWDEIFNLNLKSVMLSTQAVVPSMIDRKTGAIINIVSIARRNPGGPGPNPYSPAK